MQINFHAVDVNKYRYIQTPIGLLIFKVIGHVYPVQCEVLYMNNSNKWIVLCLLSVSQTFNSFILKFIW